MKLSTFTFFLLSIFCLEINAQQVSGQVFCDTNADGLKEIPSIGIAGLAVTLVDQLNGVAISTTTTDGDGLYSFDNVAGEVYVTVDVMGMNYSELFASGASSPQDSDMDSDAGTDEQSVDVLVDDEDVILDIGLYGSGTITGNIWIDTDGDFMDTGDPIVSDYMVELLRADDLNTVIQTNTALGALGTYLFGGLLPGEYVVQIAQDNYLPGGPLFEMSGCPGFGDPNQNIENDDNGMDGNPVRTDVIMVTASCAPNFTEIVRNVDFCFYFGCDEESQLSRPTCEEASEALICDIGFLINTCHVMPSEVSPGLQPIPLCPGGGTAGNISWFGFKAPSGDYDLTFNPFNCSGNTEIGAQLGIYTDCEFENSIFCSPDCSASPITIPSNIFEPDEIYYLFIDGCFGTVCGYEFSIDGQFSYEENTPCFADDYTPFSETTDWYHSYGDLGGSGNFWFEYQKDTVINGQTYQLILDPEQTLYDPLIMRENIATRQVFMYLPNEGGTEILYYDFSLEVGDDFVSPGIGTFATFTVESIGVDTTGPRPLKVWNMRTETGFPLTYTEAVGGDHIDYARYLFISDPVFNINCAYSYCEKVSGDDMCMPNPRHQSEEQSISVSICGGEVIVIGENTIGESGVYADSLQNQIGCDSIINYNLTVLSTIITNIDTLVCGDSFMTFESSGTYTTILSSASTGCDSTVIIDLTLVPMQETELAISICEGDVIVINGEEISAAGTYIDTIIGASGCIELITTNIVTIEGTISSSLDTSICSGETYLGFDIPGTYTVAVGSSTDCEVLTLTLSVTEPALESSDVTFCEGDSTIIGGNPIFIGGVYQDTTYNTDGCIGTLSTYNVTVLPIDDPSCTVATSDELDHVNIYPNPATDVINITGMEKESILTMYKLDGQLVKKTYGKQIDVSSLVPGLYLLLINTDEGSTVKRVVID